MWSSEVGNFFTQAGKKINIKGQKNSCHFYLNLFSMHLITIETDIWDILLQNGSGVGDFEGTWRSIPCESAVIDTCF